MKNIISLALLATCIAGCVKTPESINGNLVFFDFDSAEITSTANKSLKNQAAYLKANPDKNVILIGHCDERGSDEYNAALGAARAGNAAHVLMHNGIPAERIKTMSYGKDNPQFYGVGEDIWQKNRNVTTIVM